MSLDFYYTSPKINENAMWIQIISKSNPPPGAKNPFYDVWDVDNVVVNYPYYPYQNTVGHTANFYDVPGVEENGWFHGDVLLEQDGEILLRFSYGFKVNNGKTTKDPLRILHP